MTKELIITALILVILYYYQQNKKLQQLQTNRVFVATDNSTILALNTQLQELKTKYSQQAQLLDAEQGENNKLANQIEQLQTELTKKRKLKKKLRTVAKITLKNQLIWIYKLLGITREEFNLLNTALVDKAHIANIIKKLAANSPPEKMAEMLDRMFEHLMPKTAEAMFNQMVNHNPVFTEEEKQALKDLYQKAKTKEERKQVWQTLTSHQAQREAHQKKTQQERDKIFEQQVNNNPAYGPPGTDTQERRDRFQEYQQATPEQQEQMQEAENTLFTQGENAHQWADYFTANANYEAGVGDDTINCEGDDAIGNGQFSFADSLKSINKLKDIVNMKPEGMQEGMAANKPYWQVIMSHPLTYIFLFIGLIMAVLAAVTRKNK